LKIRRDALEGLKVTVMGLGLNGGGLESARFFARHGAKVTVTDLRKEDILSPSMQELAAFPIRYVLGRHDLEDFSSADLVIKNPAVRPDSPFLLASKDVETDISVFLSLCPAPLLAVTGSKGKSTTSSALHFGLARVCPGARLGGNITTSPLTFLDELSEKTPVVLELSSWQLGDLAGRGVLRPKVAVITNIHPDHQDRYGSMEAYVADKKIIYREQRPSDFTVVNFDDDYGRIFGKETPAAARYFSRRPLPAGIEGAWLEDGRGWVSSPAGKRLVVPESLKVLGEHQRMNLLAVGLGLTLFGMDATEVAASAAEFPGIEHRIELCGEVGGVRYYNDSAATIPQALVAAVKSFDRPLHLITGGTDKCLDFTVFSEVAAVPKDIYLLAGTGTDKLKAVLEARGRTYRGPFETLETAIREAAARAEPGDVVALSPGCTSFGMFLNEFDRGRKFKDLVRKIVSGG